MTTAQITAMQKRIGTTPDGQWGPMSSAACKAHLRSLMPSPNPWPASDTASMTAFYGKPGDESNLVHLPVGEFGVRYDGQKVKTMRCHKLIAGPLARILANIAASDFAYILAEFAGCYNFRPMRGGSALSTHAWGAAIDLDPDHNGNRAPWPVVATMPLDVCEMFAAEGALSAGPFWGRDGMHHQFTK